MRLWSVFFGLVTVALAGMIARRWFGSVAGCLAAVLVAANPILWVFSQEIRAYVAMPLAALALLWLADQLISRPTTRVWLALWTVELLTLYAHNLSVPIVAWLNITIVAALSLGRRWRRLAWWFAGQIALLLVYLPWLATQSQTGTPLNTPPALSPTLIWDIWASYFTGIKAMLHADGLLSLLTASFGGLAFACLATALLTVRGTQARRAWLTASQVVLLPVFQLAIILAARIDFHPRYFIVGVPATLILIAAGAARLFSLAHMSARRPSSVMRLGILFPIITLIVAIAILGCATTLLYSSPIYQHDDFRAIAQHYATLGPEDVIVIPYGWEPTLDYYQEKLDIQARFVDMPRQSDPPTLIEALSEGISGAGRIEVLTWYQLPADVRGAYPCLLNTRGAYADTLTVSGLKTDTYMLDDTARLAGTTYPSTQLTFGPARQEGDLLVISGARAACVLIPWRLNQSVVENLSAVITSEAPNGQRLHLAADVRLLNDRQLPTSAWLPNSQVTTFHKVEWPDGLPVGEWPLDIRVYSDHAWNGYAAVTPDGQNAGRVVAVARAFKHADTAAMSIPTYDAMTKRLPTLPLSLYLQASETQYPVRAGAIVRFMLGWWQMDKEILPFTVKIVVETEQGTHASPAVTVNTLKTLTFHMVRIPSQASGKVTFYALVNNERVPLYPSDDLAPIARQMTEPGLLLNARFDTPPTFEGVGQLIGAMLSERLTKADYPTITLLWRGTTEPLEAYTVFVHLRAADGTIIAQSDSQPAGGTRPTTSWIPGEYITDPHTLTWNRTDYHGPATLIVGFYDSDTNQRIRIVSGSDDADFVELPISVNIE
jgi:hypothetical protein